MDTKDGYYDIILLGKTGRGKSTLGNRLLQVSDDITSEIPGHFRIDFSKEARSATRGNFFKGFVTSDDVSQGKRILSVTESCLLVANESTGVRVLDSPGFSPTDTGANQSVYEANLQIFRWIVRQQLNPTNKMRVQRVVYFLPDRGIPEKADSSLQKELQVMYHYFGLEIFKFMVIAVTQELRYQSHNLTDDKDFLGGTQQVFLKALRIVIGTAGSTLTESPPIVYIAHNEGNHFSDIKAAKILAPKGTIFVPKFQDDVCSRCTCKIRYSKGHKLEKVDPRPVGIIRDDNEFEQYEKSKCHPPFVQKYHTVQKIAGGAGHIATLGVPYGIAKALDRKVWPGFNNSDEICHICERSPGSAGCCPVEIDIIVQGKEVHVDHTNNL